MYLPKPGEPYLGFVEIPPYNTSHLPGTRFFSLKLAA
jgi:hypothetical protein